MSLFVALSFFSLYSCCSELESRRAEVEELRSKLGQLQEYSSVNELKEENAMLRYNCLSVSLSASAMSKFKTYV